MVTANGEQQAKGLIDIAALVSGLAWTVICLCQCSGLPHAQLMCPAAH